MRHSNVYLSKLAALLAFGLTAFVPAAGAGAATVSVFEEPLFKTPGARWATARVEAQPEEANRLSIALAGEADSYVLQVRDDGEPIQAGSGCVGGGAAGAPVSCPLTVFPSTVTVVLGNRGAALDAGSFPGRIEVWGGSGDDSVTTGDGYDAFYPTRCGPNLPPLAKCDPGLGDGSTGADRVATGVGGDLVVLGDGPSQVFAGPGHDWVRAAAAPNGPDAIDLGEGTRDVADYHLRQTPLRYTADGLANDGAPGEGDAILGAEVFAGGSGNDLLVGDADGDYLVGGGGADRLTGQGGDDWLVGETGEGNRLRSVDGLSLNPFRISYPVPRELRIAAGGDIARGGAGNDRLLLDGGPDSGYGGPGEDSIRGNAGRDRLFGQSGRNRLDGGPDRDRCRGGGRGSVVLRCEI